MIKNLLNIKNLETPEVNKISAKYFSEIHIMLLSLQYKSKLKNYKNDREKDLFNRHYIHLEKIEYYNLPNHKRNKE